MQFLLFFFSLHLGIARYHPTLAAPVKDNTNGTWEDLYTDSAGISSSSNAGFSVDHVQLKNAEGTFTAPYVANGYIITTTIMPQLVGSWGQVSYTGDIPEGTSVLVQLLDSTNVVYSSTLLSANDIGSTANPLVFSSIPVDQAAAHSNNSQNKFGRVRVKITLQSTDTDLTPTIDSLLVTWTPAVGPFSTQGQSSNKWTTFGGTKHFTNNLPYYNQSIYPALRWTYSIDDNFGGSIVTGVNDDIIIKTRSETNTPGYLVSLDKNTGSVNWSRPQTGPMTYVSFKTSISQDGTIYWNGHGNDVLVAHDAFTGRVKWSHAFVDGHTQETTNIGEDGTIYTIRQPSSSTAFTIYAFNPDGSVKWTSETFDPPGSVSIYAYGPVLDYQDDLYVNCEIRGTNTGYLVKINHTDGTTTWKYNTGDVASFPIVGPDNTVYTANSSYNQEVPKNIFAINPDGTLKWKYELGTNKYAYSKLSLRFDNTLLALRADYQFPATDTSSYIDIINSDTGQLIRTHQINNFFNAFTDYYLNFFTDSQNGYYLSQFTDIDNNGTKDYASFHYYDSDSLQKWTLNFDTGQQIEKAILDQGGDVYLSRYTSTPKTYTVMKLSPWILISNTDSVIVAPGQTISLSATTSMLQTNLESSQANQVQVYFENSNTATLSYSSTNDDGNTIWTGTYTIPTDFSDGAHTYTIEANAANIITDTTLHFSSPASGSENTGITTTGQFTVDTLGPNNFLISPSGYTNDNSPTFSFKKSTDQYSNISHYQINVDTGHDTGYQLSNIPASVDNNNPVWKDDSNYYVQFDQSNQDNTNHTISIDFKQLSNSPLAEGLHSWELTSMDSLGNQSSSSQEFMVDTTAPKLSNLFLANISPVQNGQTYKINNNNPEFSGKAYDEYQGSQIDNDTFQVVSSGPRQLSFNIFKLKPDKSFSTNLSDYEVYLNQTQNFDSIKDTKNVDKSAEFYITLTKTLQPGTYRVAISITDNAGNNYDNPPFYLNYTFASASAISNIASTIPKLVETISPKKSLDIEIVDKESSLDTASENENKTKKIPLVTIKIVDKYSKPIPHVKVELHSDPKIGFTNDQGIVAFTDVDIGQHTIKVNSDGYTGQHPIDLANSDNPLAEEFKITVQVTKKIELPWLLIIIALCSIIILVTIMARKKKKISS